MLPTFRDVQSAAARLAGHAHVTPVVTSRSLDEACGARVFLKCENLQRVGAFKFRGAWNAMSRLSPDIRARGVLAYSSGNHAQAVALAGKLLGAPTTIVMPSTAPAIKRAATEAYGATVVPYDVRTESREAIAEELERERGLALIPPFDHPHVIAGQGTAALELHAQQPGIDTLLVPCGGGGLLTGSALASHGAAPRCRVIGVEPELADDATRSFRTKALQTVTQPATIADGTRTPSLGALTFPLLLEHVADMVTVSEEAIVDAVRFLFLRVKIVVEPSGALGVAALLSGAIRPEGRVGVILSGGNVDPETMAAILDPK
jgi:threo-3-hydroxy-L-aspartate ammonia-lyase